MQREARISKSIQGALRQRGYFCFKVWGNEMQMAGLPDILVCAEGLFIGLEVKIPESRDHVSPIQDLRHSQIRKAKGRVFVVCSATEALRVIEEVIREVGLDL